MMHGWLVLDKPLGMSSAQAVGKVKWLLKSGLSFPSPFTGEGQGGGIAACSKPCGAVTPTPGGAPPALAREGGGRKRPQVKIGHAGTLDPLASGILPLCLGEATKTVPFAMSKRKVYRFTAQWGEERSTDDAEGHVTRQNPHRPARAEIETLLPAFTGRILQIPPAFSAIKQDGKRAYALARAGETVELKPREVVIHRLALLEAHENHADFEVECGQGTYIRSLARDVGRALGTCAYVSALRRTRVGKFDETAAISLEMLEELVHKGGLAQWLQPVESVLDDIPAWEVDSARAKLLTQGGAPSFYPQQEQPIAGHSVALEEGALIRAHHHGALLALAKWERGTMKPVRVFNLAA